MRTPHLALGAAGFLVLLMLHCGSELVAAVPPAGWYDYSAYTDVSLSLNQAFSAPELASFCSPCMSNK
ncbi:unnamed protein product [Urochloa humidicola]